MLFKLEYLLFFVAMSVQLFPVITEPGSGDRQKQVKQGLLVKDSDGTEIIENKNSSNKKRVKNYEYKLLLTASILTALACAGGYQVVKAVAGGRNKSRDKVNQAIKKLNLGPLDDKGNIEIGKIENGRQSFVYTLLIDTPVGYRYLVNKSFISVPRVNIYLRSDLYAFMVFSTIQAFRWNNGYFNELSILNNNVSFDEFKKTYKRDVDECFGSADTRSEAIPFFLYSCLSGCKFEKDIISDSKKIEIKKFFVQLGVLVQNFNFNTADDFDKKDSDASKALDNFNNGKCSKLFIIYNYSCLDADKSLIVADKCSGRFIGINPSFLFGVNSIEKNLYKKVFPQQGPKS